MARVMKDSGIEWIGTIPDDWRLCKLKNIIEFQNGYAFDSFVLSNDGRYPVIRIGDIKDGGIDILNANKIDDNQGLDNFLIKDKDILLAMSGATVGKLGYVDHIETECYINQRVGIIRAENSKYIYYYLSTDEFIKYVMLLSAGSAQPNISTENVNNYYLSFPNKEGQKKIVTFLDEKVGDINEIIKKIKASIEEYKKYRKAIVIQAVTKGLHSDVAMKKTDSDWIGEIPAHWDYVRIQRLFEIVDERNEDENALLLSLYTALGVKPRNELEEKGNKASTVINYKKVQKNDVIVNKLLAWMGAIGYSDYEGVTSPDYDVYRARNGANVVKNYYNEYFRNTCFNGDCYKYGHGIMLMRWRTYPEEFLRIRVPNPPLAEQQEIADYLAEKCGEIDTLIAKKEAFVEEMEAYKKSVIYEYVTGKKEVL